MKLKAGDEGANQTMHTWMQSFLDDLTLDLQTVENLGNHPTTYRGQSTAF